MLKPFSKTFRALLTVFFFVAVGLPAVAQNPPSSQVRKSGASTTCDGALDIVPSKAMTFARKRRPAKTGKPQTTPADSKPAQKKPGDSKQGS